MGASHDDWYVVGYKDSLFPKVTGICSHQNYYMVSVMTLLEITKPEGQHLLQKKMVR